MKCIMIILNYQDSNRALELANKCMQYKVINKIVIVDNCSPDNSYENLVKFQTHKIDVVKTLHNGGFASGNNYGAKYAIEKYNPEFILFANTDTDFPEKNIEFCLQELKKRNDLGLISTRMVGINGDEEKSYWMYTDFRKQILNCFWIYRRNNYINNNKNNNNLYENDFKYVDVVRGSFMCFKALALKEAGFFDEATFLYYEEDIISKRLNSIGYKVGVLLNKYYIHNHIEYSKNNKVNTIKNLNKSCYHYQKEYYNINSLQQSLLYIFLKYSELEYRIIEYIKNYIK